MRLQRKLKKKIIKVFGRGTYVGIISGYLTLNKYQNGKGVKTVRTQKLIDRFFYTHQYNPYLTFATIRDNR